MVIMISIISAILAGMGIGGGSLFVLFSTLFLNFNQKYAQTLNLVMFIAVGLSATLTNIKNKMIDFKLIKKVVPLLILGSLIGTYLTKKIGNNDLKKYFAYFLVAIGIYEIITSLIRIKKAKNNTNNKK